MICSRTGATAWQGPHHSAQKSTRTGTPASSSRSKDASVALTSQGSNVRQRPQRGIRFPESAASRFFAPHAGQATIGLLMASS